jgi:hypothetical protein
MGIRPPEGMADIQGACLCRGSVQHWKGRLLSEGFSLKGFRRLDNRRKSQDGVVRPLLKKKPLQGMSPATALRLKMLAGAETSRWGPNPQKLPDSSRPYREQNV